MDYKIIGCFVLLVGLYVYARPTIEGGKWEKKFKKMKKTTQRIGRAVQPSNIKPMEKCYVCKQPHINDGNKQFCKSKQEQRIKLEDRIFNTTAQLDKMKESMNDTLDANYYVPGLIDQLDLQTTDMQQQSLQLEALIKNNYNINGYLEKNNVIYDETNIELNKDNALLEIANEIYM